MALSWGNGAGRTPCMSVPTIGFLGTGRMATALALGWIRNGLTEGSRLWGSDPSPAARDAFGKATGAHITADNSALLAAADVIFVAVKPDQVTGVLAGHPEVLGSRHLIVSIAAGVSISRLEEAVPEGVRVIRVMPNTPALVGASASAYALGTAAKEEDGEFVERLLSGVGTAIRVKESWLDAVTGLSGSGPAYGYVMIEALADGGVAAGLPRDVAQKLAAQTLLGAARMVLETGQHPGALKDAVCSPGGTTIEGVLALERGGVRAALMNAVREATRRARELG